jgi:hypothetical protein
MNSVLNIRIVLLTPPRGIDFAIQKGRGSGYDTVQKQRSTGGNLVFEFPIAVKDSREDAVPTFTGPFVQGPPGDRFIYVDVGTYAGQSDTSWSRRIKVPLKGITWEMVESSAVLEAHIPGTGRDGGPACATVRPDGGWTAV